MLMSNIIINVSNKDVKKEKKNKMMKIKIVTSFSSSADLQGSDVFLSIFSGWYTCTVVVHTFKATDTLRGRSANYGTRDKNESAKICSVERRILPDVKKMVIDRLPKRADEDRITHSL